jgi:hypothetical protein
MASHTQYVDRLSGHSAGLLAYRIHPLIIITLFLFMYNSGLSLPSALRISQDAENVRQLALMSLSGTVQDER